ncbi:hypothetical protein AAF712_016182 [Marasmius tenuissimus]|uniref:Uncharacterized protein n=1 Tax=Marasmius tenuissimus TaxID=585030 RepID=A0ABR2Z789_9AGAR
MNGLQVAGHAHRHTLHTQTGEGNNTQQPTSTPHESWRGLRGTTSTASVAGETVEKDNTTDNTPLSDTPDSVGWAANKKWVIMGIKANAKHLELVEGMQTAITNAAREARDEARQDQEALVNMLQDAQSPGLVDLFKDPIILSILNTSWTLQNNL